MIILSQLVLRTLYCCLIGQSNGALKVWYTIYGYGSYCRYGRIGLVEKIWYNTAVRYGMVWYGMVRYGMVWYGTVWYGMVWYVWYGIV